MGNATIQAFVDRLIRLEEEKKTNAEMISDLKQEMKSNGFDADGITELVRRKMFDEAKLSKLRAKLEAAALYAEAIGQADLFA